MTNLHYIADEQLGGVEREYAEVEREPVFGDLVIYDGKVREVTYVGLTAMSLDARIHIGINVMRTLDPTGNVRIDGTVYRMVDRKAAVGEKVLITNAMDHNGNGYSNGAVYVTGRVTLAFDELTETEENITLYNEEYVVLEPVELTQSADLSLDEADVRNNPRQVINLIANMAGRLSKLEVKVALTDDRVSRLGTANQQAYDIVSRNVETWAQEIEAIKARMGDAGRALTAEERREL